MVRLRGRSCIVIAISAIAIFMANVRHCNANCIARSLFQNARRSEPSSNEEISDTVGKVVENKPNKNKKSPPFPSGNKMVTVTASRRNRCCPYEFDGNNCRVLDDRVLCGYDKNVGKPKSKKQMLPVSGGCRLRGGRLECGYEQGPYTNPRRPPVWDSPHYGDADGPGNGISDEQSGKDSTRRPAAVTRCVEMDNRIVCRKV